jgi:hypothetical protein
MKGKFKHQESRGLPGGPNEVFEYITGVFSTNGYKRDSPDVNNPFNIINSGNITMKGVDFPVMGTDNLGNQQAMIPGNDYQFPGDQVFEIPMAQTGGGKIGKRGFLYTNNDIISGGGTLNFPTGTRINASAVVPKGFNPTFKGSGSFGINQQLGNFNIGNRLDVPVRNDGETGERLPYTLKNTLSAEWKKSLGDFDFTAKIEAPLSKNTFLNRGFNTSASAIYNIPPNKKKSKGKMLANGGALNKFLTKAQYGQSTYDPILDNPAYAPAVSDNTQPYNYYPPKNGGDLTDESINIFQQKAAIANELIKTGEVFIPANEKGTIKSLSELVDIYDMHVTAKANQGTVTKKKEQDSWEAGVERVEDIITNLPAAAKYSFVGGGLDNMPRNYNQMLDAGIDPSASSFQERFGYSDEGMGKGSNPLSFVNNMTNPAKIAHNIDNALSNDNYGDAAIEAAGLIPGLGGLLKGLKAVDKGVDFANTLKKVKIKNIIDDDVLKKFLEASDDVADLSKKAPATKNKINWGKWNKEIPKNKALMKEYDAIEKTAKANGTWMKNADGTKFKGSPEQFVQQNSKNYKKAYPDGASNVYRGTGENTPNLRDNKTIFTADKELAKVYANNPQKILGPHDFTIKSRNDERISSTGGLYDLLKKNSDNSISWDGASNDWSNLDLNNAGLDPKNIKKFIEFQKKHSISQKKLMGEYKQHSDGSWHHPSGQVMSDELYTYEMLNPHADNRIDELEARLNNPYTYPDNIQAYKKMKKDLGSRTTTDHIASYMERSGLDNVTIRNINDSGYGDVSMVNHKLGNYLKSNVGNNGMFDMTNPNIFKLMFPFAIGASTIAGQQEDKPITQRPVYQYGGASVDNDFPEYSPITGFNPNAGVDERFIKSFKTQVIEPGVGYTRNIHYDGPSNEGEVLQTGNYNEHFLNPGTISTVNLNNATSINFDGNIEGKEKMLRKLNRQNFTGSHGFRGRGWKNGLSDVEIQEFKDENPFYKKDRVREVNYDLTKADPTRSNYYKNPDGYRFQTGGNIADAESITVSKKDMNTYKAFFNEEIEGLEAQKIYDKLNRIYYKQAKAKKMSPPNYILTYVIRL